MAKKAMHTLTKAAQDRVVAGFKRWLDEAPVGEWSPRVAMERLVKEMEEQGSVAPWTHVVEMVTDWLNDSPSPWKCRLAGMVLQAVERDRRMLHRFRAETAAVVRAALSDAHLKSL